MVFGAGYDNSTIKILKGFTNFLGGLENFLGNFGKCSFFSVEGLDKKICFFTQFPSKKELLECVVNKEKCQKS